METFHFLTTIAQQDAWMDSMQDDKWSEWVPYIKFQSFIPDKKPTWIEYEGAKYFIKIEGQTLFVRV